MQYVLQLNQGQKSENPVGEKMSNTKNDGIDRTGVGKDRREVYSCI